MRCSRIPAGGAVRFHPRFVDLAGHYGFVPPACRPARAQTKGKDERNVGYDATQRQPAGGEKRAQFRRSKKLVTSRLGRVG